MPPLDADVERAIRTRLGESEFVRWFGLEFASFGDGECEIRLPVRSEHLNPGGIVHGGVIATILDAAIGLALRTRLGAGSQHVTLNLDVHYLGMAREGTLVARGAAVHSGSRTGFGEATLRDDAGRLVAKGSATFMIVTGRTPK